jgi:hypothetical protein
MRCRVLIPLFALALPLGCGSTPQPAVALAAGAGPAGDVAALSDEFEDSGTLASWRHVFREERWNADQLERFDIGKSQRGWMLMMPFTSTWYQDYRGVMAFKPAKGDFVMTTRLKVTGRSGQGAPRSQFSLAGIMLRVPRPVTPQTWRPGGENYVFLSLGAADQPGAYKFEVKTTVNSNSQLRTEPAPSGEALIQVARIGPSLVLLTNAGQGWRVFQRYHRTDFPAELQAGLTCYTDYPSASRIGAQQHNGTVIRTGNPDLLAYFDYVRFRSPKVPANLAGRSLADPSAVPDGQLLTFLGDAAAR